MDTVQDVGPGDTERSCGMQRAHVATDEYERADDGYPYNPHSDYYDVYRDSSTNATSPHDTYNDTYSNANLSETDFQGQTTKDKDFQSHGSCCRAW